ncbi:methionine synthase [Roseospira marina]|uniref:Methionine synthase n=1 Tax=Roseospira marina TaxID=140057 RepID=A0A5M6IDP1_9PROT|nr:methionine synthase [Roseospira marina]KAA5605879.1 methionine synthase [Roseospira marina]MBB4313701.1 5-methyltetrahydrofolate--homocysteine methyltransferase [Roseospira marina]MBB5086863.1 5-methyltetrahydrofolate--homocysteine methyltransferase [Roseospira marina]
MSDFLDHLSRDVLLCDGGMGSLVQAMDLSVEGDFWGKENCTEVLSLSRPDVVREVHQKYYGAGSDVVQTNTFGGSPITLAEFDLQDQAFEINKRGVELAREAAETFTDGRRRYVLGSIGPGTKLPSLGHIDYDSLEAAFTTQAEGLIAGGCDGVLVETCQDPLQFKAAINGIKAARITQNQAGVPIFLQVTVETTGTLLVGADIAAAATVAQALGVDSFGMNCATGPAEMAEHVRWVSENWGGYISLQPNAGLPELRDGATFYPLTPRELADWHRRFIAEDKVNLVGGCCGTTPEHIAAIDAMLRDTARAGSHRPAAQTRTTVWVPSVASLYSRVELRQENAILSIGERCNANGSKKFRDLQDAEDWDAIVGIARDQVKDGSHTLDVCTAFVGRNEISDMTEVVTRLRGSVNAPLVFDSTETPVLEAAMKLYGGKPIINSINFEDGEEIAAERLKLARKHGATVIALTIDEDGMAKTADKKLEIAKRLYDFAVNQHGLPPADLMFDPLTFTICTGNEDDRKLGMETLEGIRLIHEALPECQIALGLSNISFGLKAVARHVLNSVFLDHAVRHGMTGAIIHVAKIKPLHAIPEAEVKAAEALIYDKREEGGPDPLQEFIRLYQDRSAETEKKKERPAAVEERLQQRIVDGDRQGLDADLDEAMQSHAPLKIINEFLLGGMKVVGELFGAGKMQLPFVLQSAETMKAAVAHLEPHMEKIKGQEKGTLVLATVKGDVHDIGKNLVDIILTNNGYKVVNIGIKQPIAAILQAAEEHKADAIGMSGLLVKSTVIMKDNLVEMTREGWDTPVILGGAALTRAFVEQDCVAAYEGGRGRVAYARDAFDGLTLMSKVMEGDFDGYLAELQEKRASRPSRKKKAEPEALDIPEEARTRTNRPVEAEEIRLRRQELHADIAPPEPPFWGARVLETSIAPKTLVPYVNENTLYQFQWGMKKSGRTLADWKAWAVQELRPIFHDMARRCTEEGILKPQAVYGYWKAASEGDAVVLFEPDGTTEVARFAFPRQDRPGGLCLADFFRDINDPQRDVIGLQAVTMGAQVSEVARQWFAEDRYKDYLYLHGIGVEMAEALAEVVHKRIRGELGYASEDSREIEGLFKQDYRGSRYSFGYPACPNLADQHRLLELLGADRIGLSLTDEDELVPEQSTSAIVILHPQAKYFRV